MASELKPCPFCGGTDVNLHHSAKAFMSWVSCKSCGLDAPSETGVTDEEAITYWNTRPAPAATDAGLVTVGYAHRGTIGLLLEGAVSKAVIVPKAGGDFKTPVMLVEQAEELLAAERAENDEAYELGKRDGYSEAVQEIDLKTGGDGEYRYCTDHDPDRHTPDPASMIQRIAERFETLNTMESISEINEWKERAEKAEADNAAQAARIKELSEALDKQRELDNESTLYHYNRAKALEAKLAAADEALEPFAAVLEDYDPDWEDDDVTAVLVVGSVTHYGITLGDFRKARAVLGGK